MRSQRQSSFSSDEEVPFIKPELPAHNARWGVHYASPSMMIGFFVAGLFCASFHNSFYQSLDNTMTGTIENQQWALRVGMGLAFATKASFAATIGIAFTQYLWVVTRRQYMSLSALDAMFSLTSTPISFYNWEVFTKATVLFLVACSMWSMPLLATFSPGTLSVKDELKTRVHAAWVLTLNIAKAYKHYPAAWHRTENGAIAGASLLLLRLLARTAASMSIVSATDQGWETYNMTFHAPALKCLTLSDAMSDPVMNNPGPHYNSLQEAWVATDMSLNGNYYKGAVNELTNNYIFIRTTEKNLTCNLWNATYEGDFSLVHHYDETGRNYYLPECHVKGTRSVQLLAPTNYSISNNISDYPPGGGAYQSIFLALSSLLVTELGPNFGKVGENPLLMSSQLAYCPEIPDYGMWEHWNRVQYCPGGWLGTAIEQLSHNFTMSLVNSRGHNWEMSSEASSSFKHMVYTYDAKMLTTVYLSGAAITFCCLLLGLWSYHVNGYSATNSFSTILFTTRNRDLDEVSAAHCLGSHPLPEEVASVKLRFGNIGENHIAFGLKDTVTRLRRGQVCH